VQAGQAHGAQILTIEGMAEDPIGRHVLEAFAEGGAVQCGFCTPGFVLSARALLAENPAPTVGEIRQALAGNLCRCTGYKKIVEAVAAAGERVASEQLKVGRGEAGQRPVHTAGFVRPGSRPRPGAAIQGVVLDTFRWNLLGQMTAQPVILYGSTLNRLVQTMPLPLKTLAQAQHRKRGYGPGQTDGIHHFAQGVSLSAKSVHMNRLTKFDYPVNVLLGSLLCFHTPSFHPRAVPDKGSALLFV